MNDYLFWVIILCAFGYAYIVAKVFWSLHSEKRWRGVALTGVLLVAVIPVTLTFIKITTGG